MFERASLADSHECNAFCHDDLHCETIYTWNPDLDRVWSNLDDPASGVTITEVKLAPEAPPPSMAFPPAAYAYHCAVSGRDLDDAYRILVWWRVT